jgi:hypothetical protein
MNANTAPPLTHQMNYDLLILECKRAIQLQILVKQFNTKLSSVYTKGRNAGTPILKYTSSYLIVETDGAGTIDPKLFQSWMVEPTLVGEEIKVTGSSDFSPPKKCTVLEREVHAFHHFVLDISLASGRESAMIPADVQGEQGI